MVVICIGCGCELTGGLDTYGPPHEPQCYECFFTKLDRDAEEEEAGISLYRSVVYGDMAEAIDKAVRESEANNDH